MTEAERGHRVLGHTADVMLEAWGPDLGACLQEATGALVDTYVDNPAEADVVDRRRVHVDGTAPEELLVAVLEEIIFALDTERAVPVRADVALSDGGADLLLALADPASVEGTGAVPKAVSRSLLEVDVGPSRSTCRVLVDV